MINGTQTVLVFLVQFISAKAKSLLHVDLDEKLISIISLRH